MAELRQPRVDTVEEPVVGQQGVCFVDSHTVVLQQAQVYFVEWVVTRYAKHLLADLIVQQLV